MRQVVSCLAIWVTVPFSALAQDKSSPLDQVPPQARIVAHVGGALNLKEKVDKTIRRVAPGWLGVQMATSVEFALADLLSGREIMGVPTDGHVFVVLNELPPLAPGQFPKLAVIVQVDDYKAFRDGLLEPAERRALRVHNGMEEARFDAQPVFFVEREGYAVVAFDAGLARELAKPRVGFTERLEPALAKRFLESDLALYADLGSVYEQYGEFVLEWRKNLKLFMLDQAVKTGATEEMIQYVDQVLAVLLQALKDSHALLITASLADEGVSVHGELTFHPQTKTSQLLKGSQPSEFRELCELSADFAAVGISRPLDNDDLDALIRRMIGHLTGGQDAAMQQNLELASQAGVSLSVELQSEPHGNHGIQASVCLDASERVEAELAQLAMLQLGGSDSTDFFKKRPEVRRNALSHRGFQLHAITLELDMPRVARWTGIDESTAARKWGGTEQRHWIGAKNRLFIHIHAADDDEARELLDRYLDRPRRLKDVASFHDMRQRLPEKASFLWIGESTASAQLMLDKMATGEQLGTYWDLPRARPGEEQYSGYAIAIEPTRLVLDGWLTLEMWRRYFAAVLALQAALDG